MEPNIAININVNANPVSTETLGTASTAPSSKEWVANSWHLVLSDDVGRLCSWTGIREKQCIRDLRITLAMRSAFVRKFGREEEFVEKTQLFYRGAQDRVKKIRCKAKPSIANRLRSAFVTSEILGVPSATVECTRLLRLY
ncbi:hypothetical protein ACLKA6_012821 [Drosophila palustris]